MKHKNNSKIILGIGHILLSDDGVGSHAIRELEKTGGASDIELIDGGTQGHQLLGSIAGSERLVVIDCIKAGESPGTIYCINSDELMTSSRMHETNLHRASVNDLLKLLLFIDHAPRTTFVGIEPESLAIGMELSKKVRASLPALLQLVVKLAHD